MIKNPAMRILFAAIIILLLLYGYYDSNKNFHEMKSWEFKGAVEKVAIADHQNNPVITVNGKDYDLSYIQLNKNIGIYKGDTIIKKKGDIMLKMIKPNTKDTIYCNKP